MATQKKSEWRDIVLLNALTPGLLEAAIRNQVSGRLRYEDYVGISLCRSELLSQAAYIQFLGGSWAGSLEDVPPEVFLAVCDDEASAFELMVRTNSARNRARAARANMGGVRTERLL